MKPLCKKSLMYVLGVPVGIIGWGVVMLANIPTITGLFIAVITFIVPAIISVQGSMIFGRGGFVREDRFQMLFLLLTIAMLIFTVGEVASDLVQFVIDGGQFIFFIGVIYITAFLPFALGVIRYIQRVIGSMGRPPGEIVWTIMLVIPSLVTILLAMMSLAGNVSWTMIELTVGTFMAIGFGIVASGLFILSYIFRRGHLAVPLGLLSLGSGALFLRAVFWIGWSIDLLNPMSRLISMLAYLLLGASFQSVHCMQE